MVDEDGESPEIHYASGVAVRYGQGPWQHVQSPKRLSRGSQLGWERERYRAIASSMFTETVRKQIATRDLQHRH